MTKQYRRQAEKLKHPFQLRQINVFYTSHREFSRYRLEVKLSEKIDDFPKSECQCNQRNAYPVHSLVKIRQQLLIDA